MYLTDVERIVADPISWIHSSWAQAPASCTTGIARGIINKIVVRQFSLDDAATLVTDCGSTPMIIDHWYMLREAVWYMACQRYRQQLRQSEARLLLCARARSFMRIEIVPPLFCDSEAIDTPLLWQLAWAELCPLFSSLPDGVVKRIRLLFPQQMDASCRGMVRDFDSMLFLMAIQHARKYPTTV
ncbi:hypothetical protein [Pantoea sp. B65]|uniref:hypothetical protein n=1 Tax=Pantoea sp. B65 TaxID=2813359 RepID=UPI0039B62A6B